MCVALMMYGCGICRSFATVRRSTRPRHAQAREAARRREQRRSSSRSAYGRSRRAECPTGRVPRPGTTGHRTLGRTQILVFRSSGQPEISFVRQRATWRAEMCMSAHRLFRTRRARMSCLFPLRRTVVSFCFSVRHNARPFDPGNTRFSLRFDRGRSRTRAPVLPRLRQSLSSIATFSPVREA